MSGPWDDYAAPKPAAATASPASTAKPWEQYESASGGESPLSDEYVRASVAGDKQGWLAKNASSLGDILTGNELPAINPNDNTPATYVGNTENAGRQIVGGTGDVLSLVSALAKQVAGPAIAVQGMENFLGGNVKHQLTPDEQDAQLVPEGTAAPPLPTNVTMADVMRSGNPIAPIAKDLQKVGQPLPGEQLANPFGGVVTGDIGRMAPTLLAAYLSGGAGAASEPAAVAPSLLSRVTGNLVGGLPAAGVMTGVQAANPDPTKSDDQNMRDVAKSALANVLMSGVPGSVGNSVVERAGAGALIGGGLNEANAAFQDKPTTGASDASQGIVGALLGAMHSPDFQFAKDPHLADYVAANRPTIDPLANAPLQIGADIAPPAAETGPTAPAEPVAPTSAAPAAPFNAQLAETIFKADPRTALASLDHPTLVQVAKDAGFDVKPGEGPASIIGKIVSQPTDFIHSDVLPEYMAAITPAATPEPVSATPEAASAPPNVPSETVNAPSEPSSMASALAPDSRVAVDSSGTAFTPEQGASVLSDALAQHATGGEQLPAPVTTVDRYGNAKDSGTFLRQAKQAQADAELAAQTKAEKSTLGITPDIERTQAPKWKADAEKEADIRGKLDAKAAEDDGELATQRTDDAPPWWLAGEHATDEQAEEDHNAVVGQRDDDSPPWWVAGQHEDAMWKPPVPEAIDAVHADPGKPVEQATAKVIDKSVAKAVDNTQLDRAGAKRDILGKIDAAQQNANADPWPMVPSGRGRQDALNERQRIIDTAGHVSIDVPGDGKFQVVNNRQALDAFREKVDKNPGFKKPTTKKFGTKPSLSMSPAERAKVMTEADDLPAPKLGESRDETGTQASWVIRNKSTGKAIMETFDPKKAEALNSGNYEAVPIGKHLAEINDPESAAGKAAREPDNELAQNNVNDSGEGDFAVPQADRRPDWSPRVDKTALTELDSLVEKYDGSTLADTIAQDFHEHQGAALIGQTIKSHEDLAALGSVYRNPAFETMRYIYVDDAGTVLGETAVSSRMPSTTIAFPSTEKNGAKWLVDSAPEGATGVWLSHNHPSGDPAASSQDTEFTGTLAIQLGDMPGAPKVRGHVVLDHDTFGRISASGENLGIGKVRGAAEFDPLRHPVGENFYGENITSPAFAAGAGKRIASLTPEDSSAVIVMGNKGQVVSVHTFPNAVLATPKGFALISRIGAKRGAVGIGIVTNSKGFSANYAKFKKGHDSRLLYDVIVVNDKGDSVSLGQGKQMSPAIFGKHTAGHVQRKRQGAQLYEGGNVTEPPPISLSMVKDALRNRGVSDDAIASMSKDELRAEQASMRMRSQPLPEQKVTGVKNATKEEERGMKGKAAVEHDLSTTNPEQYATAKARFDADPLAGQMVAAKLIADKKSITPEDSILLSLDAMRIINARQLAYEQAEKAMASGDEATRVAALSMVRQLDGQMETNDIASRYSGVRAGQALQARKVMIQQDYSMARMVLRAKVAKGADLTDAERSRLEKAANDIAQRTKELDAREAAIRAKEREPRQTSTRQTARAKFDDLAAQLKKIAEKDQLKPGCVV